MARSGLSELYRQVTGQNYVLLLADGAGVTVDYFGDTGPKDRLREAGLYLGSMWAESSAGTNGVGCCIATGESVVIHQTDHFDLSHTGLSCTAAPIFDTEGVLQAVLDISLLRSPSPKASQRLAQHLVDATVRRIELANMMATMRHHWVLRLAHTPEFLDVDPEAAIALDASGRIVGTTHEARQLLARIAGVDWRTPGAVFGQPLSRFFELCVDELPSLIAGRPTEERRVRLGDGSALFGHAIAPLDPPPRPTQHLRAPSLPGAFRELAGDDPRMRALQAKAARLAHGPLAILLRGETGAGKERFARAIHASRSNAGPFVAVNCAALPESLIEGELFGHAPGAFSGALAKGRPGLIEAADGGVLFLDEIGDMPYPLQARLLRVLSEGAVTRLGEHRPRPVRLKLISATHRDLPELVRAGKFRADLFFRLAAATLVIPPLREREDLEWLIDRLLRERVRAYASQWGEQWGGQRGGNRSRQLRLSPAARLALLRRAWPGNVRELINTLDVAIALASGSEIEAADLGEPALGGLGVSDMAGGSSGSSEALAAGEARSLAPSAALEAVLHACDWNVSRAAEVLGVDRSTVHRRMRRLGVSRPGGDG
nr:sigma-54-dependent Fis family transcriptional regulator [Pseudenhygromyxa sp. WMMC2535]